MSGNALDRLNAAVDALTGALDRDDIAALDSALAAVPAAFDAFRAGGTSGLSASDKALLQLIGEKLDSARVRVAVLGDLGRRRMDMLGVAGASANLTYGR